jgi:hypothetical protein
MKHRAFSFVATGFENLALETENHLASYLGPMTDGATRTDVREETLEGPGM